MYIHYGTVDSLLYIYVVDTFPTSALSPSCIQPELNGATIQALTCAIQLQHVVRMGLLRLCSIK